MLKLTSLLYSLLLSLKVTFLLTLIGGKGGGILKFVFLDVHFDEGKDSKCRVFPSEGGPSMSSLSPPHLC